MLETPHRDPRDRFSDRVEDYVRYRPGYPVEAIEFVIRETGLTPGAVIADIGSGTGISAAMFLGQGYQVYAVEPNDPMREAAERLLPEHEDFHSVRGSAENTTLAEDSVELIVAAQAFHWFDTPETRAEFSRILKPAGRIALIWNERLTASTPFLRDYEQLLLRYGTDYAKVRHENVDHEAISRFFRGGWQQTTYPNSQSFDFEGLQGRLLSCSYAPPEGLPEHAPMLVELGRIFDLHQSGGRVRFDYDTRVYLGR
jgi:SAM-dependent methyltransferase